MAHPHEVPEGDLTMDKELELLMQPMVIPENEKELRQWVKKCAGDGLFEGREPWEVAQLAIMNGFDRQVIYSVISCMEGDLMGGHIEKRSQLQFWRLTQAIELVQEMKKVKELDLRPKWKALAEYYTGEELAA